MADTRDDVRRLSNLLMVGHGAALLVIFNARAQRGFMVDGLKDLAWAFAAGLIAAFWMAFLVYRYDQQAEHRKQNEETERSQNARLEWIGWLFLCSAAAFVAGLSIAISALEPAPAAPAHQPAPTIPAPSPDVGAPEVEASAQPENLPAPDDAGTKSP